MQHRRNRSQQPTMTTYRLGIGQVVLVDKEVCRVTRLTGCDDGSMDVRCEGDMDEDRTYNVAFTNLSEPLWVPVQHKHCQRDQHVYWLAWGFDQADGPYWCDGQHR